MLAVLISVSASAQKNFIKEADAAFQKNTYYSAIDLYKKGYARLKSDVEEKQRVLYQIGHCYRLMTDAAQAEVWFKKAIKAKYDDPLALLYLAESQKQQGKYTEAIESYEKFEMQAPSDARGAKGVKSCKMAVAWMNDQTRWNVEPEYLINSKFFDFAPTFGPSRSHDVLIFASGREGSTGGERDAILGENFQDLYITERDKKGKWSEPRLLGPGINTEANEGAACLSRKKTTMYFTRCPNEQKKNLGCDIYMSRKKGSKWGDAELIKLKAEGADSVSIGHPAITPDDKVLVFASDMPGGHGGKDLWMTIYNKKEAEWGQPINLGADINTSGDEMFAFVHADGSLYFSSNGHVGMGGLDIYKAQKSNGDWNWANIENMQYPINTNAHDYGIIFEGQSLRGFLTSNRMGGKGQDDIYNFYYEPITSLLDIFVKEAGTELPIVNAKVRLVGTDNKSYEVMTDSTGHVAFHQKTDNSYYLALENNYSVNVTMDSFFTATDMVSTHNLTQSTNFVQEVYLEKVIYDIGYDFPEVQYPFNSVELLNKPGEVSSTDSLDYLYNLLIENPTMIVELRAHTDTRGTKTANRKLSQGRAQTCVAYLIAKGIDPKRLIPVGMGEDKPLIGDTAIAKMKTKQEREAAHQKNRRTEFAPVEPR